MEAFILAAGQDDNIGDVVLRRRMLRSFGSVDRRHIFVHQASEGFIEGLRITDSDIVYRSFKSWFARCLSASALRPVAIMHNSGELMLNSSMMRQQIAVALAALPTRLHHGLVGRVGVGLRNESRNTRLLNALSRIETMTYWRDAASMSWVGRGNLAPDWAFDDHFDGEGQSELSPATERPLISITMRGDREYPRPDWFESVRLIADLVGADPVVVTQVRRDAETNRSIASQLNATHFDWPQIVSHLEQERITRAIYRQSVAVISDRLHGLIIGLTEGALPLGLLRNEDLKIQRHFDAAHINGIVLNASRSSAESASAFALEVLARREAILYEAALASQRVREVDALIGAALSKRRSLA